MFFGAFDTQLSQIVVGFIAQLPIWLQMVFIAIARHGDKLFLAVATIGLLVLVFRETNYHGHLLRVLKHIAGVLVGCLIGWIIIVLTKEIISVPRPFEFGVVPMLWNAAGHAFPSGHAAVLTMIALSLDSLVSKKIGYILIALAIIVPMFRFVIGIHSIVDIVGGWMIGYIFSQIIDTIEE